jgi:hypothetical protein
MTGMEKLRANSACRSNALRMGHCAPTVMQTLLDRLEWPADAMVKAVGGLPGIGGPGECGGVLSPLMVLSLLDPPRPGSADLPPSIALGQEYLRRFRELHGSVLCKEVGKNCMRCCYRAMVLSPPLLDDVVAHEEETGRHVDERAKTAHMHFLSALGRTEFHCAHRVLDQLADIVTVTEEMRDAAAIFVGGMALTGSTCGALAAGAMAMSATVSGIERSLFRTLKMLVTMTFSVPRALRDPMNAFNPAIRTTTDLARWFGHAFGSTRCADLTGADLSSPESVVGFCAGNGLEACRERAGRVVAKVREMLAEEATRRPVGRQDAGPGRAQV